MLGAWSPSPPSPGAVPVHVGTPLSSSAGPGSVPCRASPTGTYGIFRAAAPSAQRQGKLLHRQVAAKQLWQRLSSRWSGRETNLRVCERR